MKQIDTGDKHACHPNVAQRAERGAALVDNERRNSREENHG